MKNVLFLLFLPFIAVGVVAALSWAGLAMGWSLGSQLFDWLCD